MKLIMTLKTTNFNFNSRKLSLREMYASLDEVSVGGNKFLEVPNKLHEKLSL